MIPAASWLLLSSTLVHAVDAGVKGAARTGATAIPEGGATSVFSEPLFGWTGYGLLFVTLLAVWLVRQASLLKRRRWIQRMADAFEQGSFGRLNRLLGHAEFLSTVGDLTEILRAFEARLVAEAEARAELEGELDEARYAFEALPQAGIILDVEDYLLAATPAACELFGRPESALVGERLARFVQGDLNAGSPCRVHVAAPGGVLREVHFFLRSIGKSKTDHRIGLLVESRQLLPPDETAEDGVRAHGTGYAMEAMGDLAGSVAHDFNDRLTTILGHSYVLLGLIAEGDEQRESVEEIAHAADQARLLTQQLLAFSRRQVIRPETLDVAAFLRDKTEELRALLGDAAELDLEGGDRPLMVRIDPVQLHGVLENIVRNAREAMGGAGRLLIQVAPVDELPSDVRGPAANFDRDTSWVRISLVDSGPGMDPDTLARAFEPYFTTHATEGRRGMGLPTVYGIVTQSQGRVAAANAVDRGFAEGGMAMEIYLPVVTSRPRIEVPVSPTAHVSRSRKRVCVVEDDPQVRRLVAFILNRDGFDVVTAENGQEALEICEERGGDIDLILTDVNMPYVSGLELAEEIRRRFPDTRTIFMSGFIEYESIRSDAQAPTSFLQKPFTPRELLDHVHRGISSANDDVNSHPPRILVVDDEKMIRDMLGTLIESLGYECQKACDGVEAIWKLQALDADVVISDMVMPNKDGIQTCQEIREMFPDTRIIAMSGKVGGSSSLAAAERLGAVATLTKPFSRDELLLALEKALE